MSNTSIAAPAICLFFNTLIKACSSTIGPRDALINRAVGFILSSSAAPTRPRVRLLNTKWIVRMPARSNNWSLETRIAPAALAASGVMFRRTAKVPWHRIPVVRNQNTILLSCDFEERRICRSSQSGSLHVEDVDGWLASAETHNDAGVEIFIRQKADG